MNGAGSPGQQRWIGSRPRSTSSPRSTISWQAPLPTVFGRESAIDLSFCRPRTFSISPSGGCISSTSATFCGDVVEPLDAEGEAHPPLGAELVDQQRMLGALRVLEQERRPAGLDRAVDDLRDLEVGIDLGGDADELALALEQRDPVAEVGEHVVESYGAAIRQPKIDSARRPGARLKRTARRRCVLPQDAWPEDRQSIPGWHCAAGPRSPR